MAMKISAINWGSVYLGRWHRDCEKLISKLEPPQRWDPQSGTLKRDWPQLDVRVEAGGFASFVSSFGSLFGGQESQEAAARQLSQIRPGFTGNVFFQMVAIPLAETCTEMEGGGMKQRVGWAKVLNISFGAAIGAGVAGAGVGAWVPLGAFDPIFEPCDCQTDATPDTGLIAMSGGGIGDTAAGLLVAMNVDGPGIHKVVSRPGLPLRIETGPSAETGRTNAPMAMSLVPSAPTPSQMAGGRAPGSGAKAPARGGSRGGRRRKG